MPTVVRFFGLRVVIYPNDHRPAHVHVIGHGCESVWNLGCPNGPVALRENYGFAGPEIVRIRWALDGMVLQLCRRWEEIYGDRNRA